MPEFLVYLYSNGAIDREPCEPVPANSELDAAQSVHNGPLQRVDGLTSPVCYEVRQKDGPPMSEDLAQWFVPAADQPKPKTQDGMNPGREPPIGD